MDYGPLAPINTASHSSTAQMGVSPTHGVTCCWCLCRVVTLCSLHVLFLPVCGIPICLRSPVCAHDQLVKSGQTTGHYVLFTGTYVQKKASRRETREIGLSTPAGKKTSSARHASHRARIEPKPRPMCPAGPPVSGYLAFCRKALARREKLRKVRKFHKHNYTYKAPLRGVGCSPRGDASWHDTAENRPISSSSGNHKQRLLLTYAFKVRSKLALCHMKKKHVVFLTIHEVNFSCVCQTL